MATDLPLRLGRFVAAVSDLLDAAPRESIILERGGRLLGDLVAHDDWLPASHAAADPTRYSQHLLHLDPAGRFSVVSFVWAPGQATPVHDHTVWGLVGMLRGAELSQRYAQVGSGLQPEGRSRRLSPGDVEELSPAEGDIHQVANALQDQTSISIHVYGADIGKVRRSTFDAAGRRKAFISGYSEVPALGTPRLR